MNLLPTLTAAVPVRRSAPAAQGDDRLPIAAGDRDAAGPPRDFASALREAGAPGRATPDTRASASSRAAKEPQASALQEDLAGASEIAHEAPVLAGTRTPRAAAPSTPIETAGATAGAGLPDADASRSAATNPASPAQLPPRPTPATGATPALPATSAGIGGDTSTAALAVEFTDPATPETTAGASTLLTELQMPQLPQPPHPPQPPQVPQRPNPPQPPQPLQVQHLPQPPHTPAPARAGRVARKDGEASGAVEPAPATLGRTADTGESTPADAPSVTPIDTVTSVNTADAATLVPHWQAPQPAPTPTPTPMAMPTPIQARPTVHGETDTAAVALRPPGRQQATVSGSNRLPDPEPVRAPATARTERAAESLPHAPIQGASIALPAGPADATLPAIALPPSSAAPAAVASGGAAAPVAEARMTAGPGSEAFATELGSHLTTFVRDGVQHARLHLHPAELGPVTVQIQIDGQAAQVHMAAESGLTRQALEQSMPLLAGSLREAGLTLSGGGVFEQPRQQRDPAPQGTPSGSRPGPERADEPALRPGLTAMRRRGVVDLVA